MEKTNEHILIAGYYGFGNTGDEAILAAMVNDILAARPGVEITVVSGCPQETETSHAVAAVSWEDVPGLIESIRRCDLVILGGGGLFHDYWGVHPEAVLTAGHSGMAFYGSVALLAALLEKPLMLYAVGVGPLLHAAGREHTRAIAQQAQLITVRDAKSQALLHALGVDPAKIHLSADPAFRLGNALDGIKRTSAPSLPQPVLGVVLRNWDVGVQPEVWEAQVAQAVDHFLDTYGGSAIFIPFQQRDDGVLLDDRTACVRVWERMRRPEVVYLAQPSGWEEGVLLINGCDLVLGMRLHALIFAIQQGIPAVGLGYDPKINNIMSQAGLAAYVVDLAEVDGQTLGALLGEAWERRPTLRKRLETVGARLAEQAGCSLERMVALLNNLPRAQHNDDGLPLVWKRAVVSLAQSLDASSKQSAALTGQIQRLQDDLRAYEEALAALREETKKREQAVAGQIQRLQDDLARQAQEYAHQVEMLTRVHEKALAALQEEIKKRERAITRLAALEPQLAEQSRQLDFLNGELLAIKGSRGWKLLWALWQMRLFFIPHGSRRERALRSVWRALKGFPRRFGGMSAYAFAFDEYKRTRTRRYFPDLSTLRLPGERGLVSIVLPVYNGETMIAEAIESVLAQTYSHFELIVVDDGSTDATAEILTHYARKDARIRVIHQVNQKLPRALSNGFRLARGEFLTWTSHDNRLKPRFLEKMVACLQRHPCWDVVYANMDLINEGGAPLRGAEWYAGYQQPLGSEHVHLPEDTAELNTFPNNFIGGAFVYRSRVAWLLGDYDAHQYTREDYDYWMRANALMTVRHADFRETVYEYRFHSSSLTARDDELGITRQRERLMIWDDFRRDFYLTPLVWFVDVDLRTEGAVAAWERLRARIAAAGHLLLRPGELPPNALPRLWLPWVYLRVADTPHALTAIPEGLPPNTFKALFYCSTGGLPATVDGDWDLCLAHGEEAEPPRLGEGRRGWLVSPAVAALFTALDIRARSWHLARIEDAAVHPQPARLKISVIVCTYRRGQKLIEMLFSLARQTMSLEDFEVLVVNNDPDDHQVANLVETARTGAFAARPDHLRLLLCPLLGLSQARNAGMAEAAGELLLFLDDDVIASEDLLAQFWQAFAAHPQTGVIGGHIRLSRPKGVRIPWKAGWGRYWSEFLTGYEGYTEVERWWEFPWGANWCARREALLAVGGFRTQFGRRGVDFSGGEEIVAASLIRRAGYRVAVLPQAEVIHKVDARRFTLAHVWRTIRAGLLAQYQAQIGLYIPAESSLGHSARQVGEALRRLIATFKPRNPSRKADFIEAYAYLLARGSLFLRQVRVGLRRKRRPITRQKRCL